MKHGDLCWALVDGVSWPCRLISEDLTNVPQHVMQARPSRQSILVVYSFNGPVAWGWLKDKSCLQPFLSRAESPPDQPFKSTMQHAINESRVNEGAHLIGKGPITTNELLPPAACWFDAQGPYIQYADMSLVNAVSAIKALREAAVQKIGKKGLHAMNEENVVMLSSYRDNRIPITNTDWAGGREEKQGREPEVAGPSSRGALPAKVPPLLPPVPGASAAGPFLKAPTGSNNAGMKDRGKLLSILRELKQAAVSPVSSAATHSLLTGSSKDCLPIYLLREACKGSSSTLFGTNGPTVKLVLEEIGIIEPSLLKLKHSTLLERVKKEVLKQEKKIQELQEIASAAGKDPRSANLASSLPVEERPLHKGRKRPRVDEQVEAGALMVQGAAHIQEAAVPSSPKPSKSLENGSIKTRNGALHVEKRKSDDEVDLDSILHELRSFEERLGMSSSARSLGGKGITATQPSDKEASGSTLRVELKKLKALLATIGGP